MFAARFDPTAVYAEPENGKKRRRDDDDSGSESSDESGAEMVELSGGEGSPSESEKKTKKTGKKEQKKSGTTKGEEAESDSLSEDSSGEESEGSSSEDSEDSSNDSSEEPIEDPLEASKPTLPAKKSPADSLTVTKEVSDPMEVDSIENDPAYVSKHLHIFKKLQKVQKNTQNDSSSEEEQDDVEMQDLVPMPQPALPRDRRLHANHAIFKNLDWLAKPRYTAPENTQSFEKFALSPFMMRNLADLGFKEAFSVQIAVLEMLLEDMRRNRLRPDSRGDLLVNAATGSGKTLAYVVPIVEALHQRVVLRVRAIVLVPTRPLVGQVRSTFSQLSRGTSLQIVGLRNDVSVKEEGLRLLSSVPDVVISTPGRLVDHIKNGSILVSLLRYLVIDEADRLLNQTFQNWAQVLVSAIEERSSGDIANKWELRVQKLFFSATLTTDAGKLSLLKFYRPRLVVVNSEDLLVREMFSVPVTLEEHKIQLGSAKSALKPLILARFLLSQGKRANVLVFAKLNEAVLRLSRLLELIFARIAVLNNLSVAYINSTNNSASIRGRVLRDFASQQVNILVATDLIARGLDMASITDVVNYDLPNSAREYVHRVGRTARANQKGNAYSFCFGKGEGKWLHTILRDVGRRRPVETVEVETKDLLTEGDKEAYEEALGELQKQVLAK